MLKVNHNPDVEKQALERHRKFLALSDTERFMQTCRLIQTSLLFTQKPKLPQGKGLVIKKK